MPVTDNKVGMDLEEIFHNSDFILVSTSAVLRYHYLFIRVLYIVRKPVNF